MSYTACPYGFSLSSPSSRRFPVFQSLSLFHPCLSASPPYLGLHSSPLLSFNFLSSPLPSSLSFPFPHPFPSHPPLPSAPLSSSLLSFPLHLFSPSPLTCCLPTSISWANAVCVFLSQSFTSSLALCLGLSGSPRLSVFPPPAPGWRTEV